MSGRAAQRLQGVIDTAGVEAKTVHRLLGFRVNLSSNKQDDSSGSAKQDDSYGSSKQDPSSGSAKQDDSTGSAKQDPSSGSAKQDDSYGSAKQDVSSGSAKQDPSYTASTTATSPTAAEGCSNSGAGPSSSFDHSTSLNGSDLISYDELSCDMWQYTKYKEHNPLPFDAGKISE
jgi:hypothetical protein